MVCMANNGAQISGGSGGINAEPKLQKLLQKFQNQMEEIRKAMTDIGGKELLNALDISGDENDNKAKSAWVKLSPNAKKNLDKKIQRIFWINARICRYRNTAGAIISSSPHLNYYEKHKKAANILLFLHFDLDCAHASTESSVNNYSSSAADWTIAELLECALICFDDAGLVLDEGADAWLGQEKLLKSPHFQPDAWLENMLSPEFASFIVSDDNAIPQEVKDRMREIHGCFFFGQWIAVIALSRCLLEYVIADCFKEKKEYKKKGEQSPKLSCLIKIALKHAPQVDKKDMDTIKTSGDNVMHPRDKPQDLKVSAEKCFSGILKVVRALYDSPQARG